MTSRFTKIRQCKWCGDFFEASSPNQQYCTGEFKNCSEESKKESWRKASSQYRNRYKDVCFLSSVYKLGSGFLGSFPENDFYKEHLAIRKEKNRLNLKAVNIGSAAVLNFSRILSVENFIDDAAYYIIESYPQLMILGIILLGALMFFIFFD